MNFTSHQEVALWLSANSNLTLTDILAALPNWTERPEWIDLANPEYMYEVWCRCEELVDWDKFFREHKAPFEHLAVTLPIDGRTIDRANFYASYDLSSIYIESNAETRSHIEKLANERKAAGMYLLIDPHAILAAQPDAYNRVVDETTKTWFKPIKGQLPPPEAGQRTIVDLAEAQRRFREFTFDKLVADNGSNTITIGNIEYEFPFENVVFAGGSIAKILSVDYSAAACEASDLDMFIVGDTYQERKRALELVLAWFDAVGKTLNLHTDSDIDTSTDDANTFYAIRGSVVGIYLRGVKRVFQGMSSSMSNPWEVISRFDLSHIQWAARGSPYGNNKMQFIGTPAAQKAMVRRITQCSNMQRTKPLRIIKAIKSGYAIEDSPNLRENIEIELLLEPANLQAELRRLEVFYYPEWLHSDDRILAHIERDAEATFVSTDLKFATNNIFIGGNFDDHYESLLFKTFNVQTLAAVLRRLRPRTFMRTRHGDARIMSDKMEVAVVIADEESGNLEFITRVSTEFATFIRLLETSAWPIYAGSNRQISVSAVNDNNVQWVIPRSVLLAMNERGRTCMRSQRGEPLNPADDLNIGDHLQIIFRVEVIVGDVRCIKLQPHSIIKFIDENAIAAENADFERQIAEALAASTIDAPTHIEYED